MKTHHGIHLLVASFIVFLGLVSCNVYRPLQSESSDEAHIEEGLRCYHEKDYDCAVAAFEKISDSNLKTEKLCLGYLNQAGLTLDLLLNKLNQINANMLGDLATALLPWTPTRGTAATNASTTCATYASSGTASDTKTLLSSVSQLLDCSTRLARADAYGNGGNSCETEHAKDSSNAVVDADVDFMCDTDAEACADNIATISAAQLGTSGLGSLKGALDLIPDALKSSASAAAIVRTALKTVVKD